MRGRTITGLVLGTGAAVLVTVLALAGYFLGTYQAPPVDPAWAVEGSNEVPEGAVTVRYTGTATLVFSDGDTTWMTDGWFSRPGPLTLLYGQIEPDLDAIDKGLERNLVSRLSAVFPVHSHYDHAMDAPEVAKRTGAVLLGSESTANIGRGWGLREEQIRVVRDREPIQLGKFTVTPIESKHFQFPDPKMAARALGDPKIATPLRPPVGAFDYKLGKAYALHVAHPMGTWLIQGSAGFIEGGLEGYDADVVFLGVGALGSQTDAYRENYWRETVQRTNPSRVIPIHWDSLTGPIEAPFTGPVRAAAFFTKGSDKTLKFLKDKHATNPNIEFVTLPRYDVVVLFRPAATE
ncbi:MAG: MBL fold metallo-hydrolase [Myxococcales bacterium]|nr:MBL fold metallo-hydrolase [Myxococcales bacterium]MDH3483446.1 MBL fold metallo-hydrolase [Myxococcales bacterium]